MEILKKVILILAIFTIAGVFGQGFDTLPEANPAPKANYFYKDKNGKPTKIYKPNAKMSEFAMKKNKSGFYNIAPYIYKGSSRIYILMVDHKNKYDFIIDYKQEASYNRNFMSPKPSTRFLLSEAEAHALFSGEIFYPGSITAVQAECNNDTEVYPLRKEVFVETKHEKTKPTIINNYYYGVKKDTIVDKKEIVTNKKDSVSTVETKVLTRLTSLNNVVLENTSSCSNILKEFEDLEVKIEMRRRIRRSLGEKRSRRKMRDEMAKMMYRNPKCLEGKYIQDGSGKFWKVVGGVVGVAAVTYGVVKLLKKSSGGSGIGAIPHTNPKR